MDHGSFLGTVDFSAAMKLDINNVLSGCESYNRTSTANNDFEKEFREKVEGSIEDKLYIGSGLSRLDMLDDKFLDEHEEKLRVNRKYIEMIQPRSTLPIYKEKEEILKMIQENQVVLISGETGCGKTTQVTQYILDSFIERGAGSLCNIVCTQPRRISAVAVAERVAEERGEELGDSCGYQIRLEKSLPRARGSILYCTTGIILHQMISDPLLSTFSHLVLDEIHERDIMSDFLIALMHKVLPQRPDFKLILMSATLNAEKFADYYNGCPMIKISGFTYPVEEYYLEDVLQMTGFTFGPCSNQSMMGRKAREAMEKRKMDAQRKYMKMILPHLYEVQMNYGAKVCNELKNPNCEELNLDLILELIRHIVKNQPGNGSILVFLTGHMEIMDLIEKLEFCGHFPESKYIIIPLHSQIDSEEQKYIFEPPGENQRKIIVSTNIAETSITINDVVYVINCGYIKQTGYNPKTNQQTLDAEFVSLANAHQRRGRAGRVRPGICYHLYTKARKQFLQKFQQPEIQRTRLDNVLLRVKALQLGKAKAFMNTLIDVPDEENIENSLNLLKRIEALDDDENLTPLGFHLSKLPMSPQIGKMMLLGVIFSCLDPILSISTTLDFKEAFQIPFKKGQKADEIKLRLSDGSKSDHLLAHFILIEYENSDNKKKYCRDYFLNQETVKMLLRMKAQFMRILSGMNFVPDVESWSPSYNHNSNNLALVKAIVGAGLFPNIALINNQQPNTWLRYQKGPRVDLYSEAGEQMRFHRKSILSNYDRFDSPLAVYHLRMKTGNDFVHDGTLVYPLSAILFGDRYRHITVDGLPAIGVSDKLKFRCDVKTRKIMQLLRLQLDMCIQRSILEPTTIPLPNRNDYELIRVVVELITSESQIYL